MRQTDKEIFPGEELRLRTGFHTGNFFALLVPFFRLFSSYVKKERTES